jgi:hypothetical protein
LRDRRRAQIPLKGAGFVADRRKLWMERRKHHGIFRIMYIDLPDFWSRFVMGTFN